MKELVQKIVKQQINFSLRVLVYKIVKRLKTSINQMGSVLKIAKQPKANINQMESVLQIVKSPKRNINWMESVQKIVQKLIKNIIIMEFVFYNAHHLPIVITTKVNA